MPAKNWNLTDTTTGETTRLNDREALMKLAAAVYGVRLQPTAAEQRAQRLERIARAERPETLAA